MTKAELLKVLDRVPDDYQIRFEMDGYFTESVKSVYVIPVRNEIILSNTKKY